LIDEARQNVCERVKQASLIFAENLRDKLQSKEFIESARMGAKDFTRVRLLPFYLVMIMILRIIKASLQLEVEKIFKILGSKQTPPTKSAFSQARDKIRWQAFAELFEDSVNWRYENEVLIRWRGYRVCAIDGTKLALPVDRDRKLLELFGGTGAGGDSPTAQGSIMYDIYNDIIMDARIGGLKPGERDMAYDHLDALVCRSDFGKELIIFDRGYPSYDLMRELADCGVTFVMRVKKGFNAEIDRMEAMGERDIIMKSPDKARPGSLRVRVIKFALPDGETETLATNLFDKGLGPKAFEELYFKRWPIETEYDIVKSKIEVERFSGLSENAIRQEFYATTLMANYVGCLAREAQGEADREREDKNNKYDYQININHEIGSLREDFINIMIEEDPAERANKIENLLSLVARAVEAVRPGRSKPRKKPRNVKHHHNRKPG